ncbi:MAG: dicarboxylate/amino acid:cation symporter [Lachnospiraceae bacterium]|nr:dicarboxylate/amino acid:cation symporter [Lachnospiraceae bacterium]
MRERLTVSAIDAAVAEAEEYLDRRKIDSKDLIRIKLGIEETLLFYREAFGEDAEFLMEKGASFGRRKIRVSVRGNMISPYVSQDYTSEEDRFMQMALVRMGRLPKWSYRRGANVIVFEPQKITRPEWMVLLISIVAAILCGTFLRFLPGDVSAVLLTDIISPLLNCFLGFLNAVAGPMIFLSVVWGIYSIGDTATFSVMGKRLGIRFAIYLCLVTIVVALVSMPFAGMNSGAAQGGSEFLSLYQMVLDIIPTNLFTPFSRGNTLQILFEAIVIGIAMLLIGKETNAVADLSEQLGYIVNGIMGVISKLVPVFVFGSLFTIIVGSDISSLVEGGLFFGLTIIGCIFCIILHTVAVCFRVKIGPVDLWKKTLSTFVISITTASSAAAFSDNIHTCTDKLGVSKTLANFGVPFCQILYKPGVSMLFWFAAFSVAAHDGIEISLVWVITAILICIVLAAAAPPVPGGMSASFAILFGQLGLPMEKLAVILSLTAILDFVVTATDLFSGQCILAIVSGEIDGVQRKRER